MDHLFRRFVAFAAILWALAVVSLGQTAGTGAISGTINDSSGAVVGGASVKAIEVATGETRKAVSADNGTYMLPLLKPGTYRVEVVKSGFKQSTSAANSRARHRNGNAERETSGGQRERDR